MEELLQAPTEGYGEANVIPKILAENFEIKTNLLQGAARIWYEKEPPNSILTWDDLVNKFVNQFFPPSKTTHLKNEISRFTQRFKETFGEAWDRFKEMLRACPHHGFSELTQIDTFYNGLTEQDQDSLNAAAGVIALASAKAIEKTCVTCGGAHAYYDCIATNSNQSSVCAATGSYNQINVLRGDFNKQEENLRRNLNNDMRSILGSFFQNQPSTSGTLPSNTMPNLKGEMKAVTPCSGLAYEGPSIPTNSPLEKVFEQNTEEITDKEHSNCPGSTAQVQPPVVPISILEPDVLRTQAKPTIPYLSSFADALLLMPKSASTIKSLLENKDKLFELAKVPLNENCSAMLLKKLPKKLEIWKKLSLPELTPTRMTLELADRSITRPKGVAKDVFVKEITLRVNDESVTFNLNRTMRYSSTYDDNSMNRVDVIDIACKEFVLDVLDFQYNLKSSNPTLVSDPSISKSDFYKETIVKSSLRTLTPFGESDFFLEEIKDFLNDYLIPTGIENSVYDPEGDILFLEKLLNEDPFQLHLMDLKLAEESKDSNKLPVIIAKDLKDVEKEALINVLKSHKRAIAWKISDSKGIDPRFCTHKILMEDDYKPAVQSQRRVNPKIHDVIKKEVIKLLDAGMIYHISDSPWVSPIHCVPKKGGMTVVSNENNELIPTRLVTGWRVCIDYRKLNDATRKDHFPLPFMDQMLERLAENEFYCFLDGFSGYFQISIDPQDQEKTTFTYLYGTFAYRRMPFGLCNAPGTFQRCMMSIFHDIIKKMMEVFMDDFSVFGDSFSSCLTNLDKMLERCEETNLVLNWEKCHFMCREGIVLGHKILKSGIEVDRAKVDVIAKLPHPTTVKCVRSFLGHAGFYRRFTQDFSKITRPMTHLLEKETPFVFSKECVDAFNTLKKKLTKASILVPIYYASKTMTEAQIHYTTTEKEMLVVVYAFEKFRAYLVLSKIIVYMDHSALKYLLNKQDAKPRLLWWVLLLQEFNITILDKKGSENRTADHLSRLENPHKDVLENKDINENIPLKTLGSLSSHSTPWFADIANFHARNFIKKGLTSQQKKKFFKDLLKSSKLAMRDLLGAIMVPISQQRRDKEKSLIKMRCLITLSKFVRYSMYETSGQVEVSNRGLKRILERTVGENHASWSNKLDDALWDFRTAYKTLIGCTPYKLVYGKLFHLPIELEHRAYWALKHVNFDLNTVGDHYKLQLNELSELRDQAYENYVIYKERTKKLHESKIKNRIFNVGDQVLIFNSRLKIFSGKLKTRWSGPFTITQHYFGGDIPSSVVPDLHMLPMDN
nr:reverse transcriptase domain-containing protein [Tanacetum cinerariifolium]